MNYEINSKEVKPGDIFVALKGIHNDGHNYISEALKNGAFKVIGEEMLNEKYYKRVKNAQKYLLKKVKKENQKLDKDFFIIGITGTKGKSSSAMLTYQMLKNLNVRCAYIGTLGLYYLNNYEPLENTTPDIATLNKILKKLKDNDITHVVMEVSSHALAEKRIAGLTLNAAGFTNLSQDHLDYHKNFKNYLYTKLKIFNYLNGPMIINSDDNMAKYFKAKASNSFLVGKNGDLKLNNYTLYTASSLINIDYNYNSYSIAIPLVGKHNIYNYLIALGILLNMGYDILELINVTNIIKPIRGRNELIKTKKGYIIIDYAHSPAAVKETLLTYNELKKGKIITIIGCGGNRDKLKRPIMGDIATKYSDYVIFTSDNPRDENPTDILKDITQNLKTENFEVLENRFAAIKKGVSLLKNQDYLLILGKGHEDYQIINNHKYHFDDKEEVLKLIS